MSAATIRPRRDAADGCDDDRLVRAHLSRVAEPGDRALPPAADVAARAGLVEDLRRGSGREVWQARHDRLDVTTPDLVDAVARRGIGLLVPGDSWWPTGLDDLRELSPREGPDGGEPVCLWVRGHLPTAEQAPPVAALVGARACTAYGEHVAADLAAGLVERGWTVLSGGAYGVDAAAHRGALVVDAADGPPTVAVLAGGVDRPSPVGHERLFASVLENGGALVSEHPPGTRPAAYRFLLRNRLIAAWAAGVVVVEASARSGSLNTARTARDLSRHVAAVPGPVTSASSVGTNRLLRDGAVCVTSADDVVDLLGPMVAMGLPLWPGPSPDPRAADRGPEHLGAEAVRVWQALRPSRASSVESLVVRVGLPHRTVAAALAGLELDGAAERVPSGWRRGARSDRG